MKGRYLVTSPRNSECGSARLKDLHWHEWFTDYSGGLVYLHVKGDDGTWHRVFCRKPCDKPRIGRFGGELYWLVP